MGSSSVGIGNVSRSNGLVEMAMSYSRSRIICAAARLGIADALGSSERSVEEIAAICKADPGSLYRLLRALASIGVTSETSPRRFVLTPFGEPLQKSWPNSAWPGVIFWADLLADQWAYLSECVRTGQRAFKVMESQGIQPLWAREPDASAIFRAVMGTAPAEHYMPIVNKWDFTGHRVVADLGGGGGALIEAVLTSYPNIEGMLVDLPASIDAARPRFESGALAARCKLIAADLVEAVPPGADVYMLKHFLHGRDDDSAVGILKNCRQVMPADGRLLVIEFVLPDVVSAADPLVELHLMSDLNMMTVTGGKERSGPEWASLLDRSGFQLMRIIPVPSESDAGPRTSDRPAPARSASAGQTVSIVEAHPV